MTLPDNDLLINNSTSKITNIASNNQNQQFIQINKQTTITNSSTIQNLPNNIIILNQQQQPQQQQQQQFHILDQQQQFQSMNKFLQLDGTADDDDNDENGNGKEIVSNNGHINSDLQNNHTNVHQFISVNQSNDISSVMSSNQQFVTVQSQQYTDSIKLADQMPIIQTISNSNHNINSNNNNTRSNLIKNLIDTNSVDNNTTKKELNNTPIITMNQQTNSSHLLPQNQVTDLNGQFSVNHQHQQGQLPAHLLPMLKQQNSQIYSPSSPSMPPPLHPPPKLNGDNTLLKALLQTAPKNAIPLPVQQQQQQQQQIIPNQPPVPTLSQPQSQLQTQPQSQSVPTQLTASGKGSVNLIENNNLILTPSNNNTNNNEVKIVINNQIAAVTTPVVVTSDKIINQIQPNITAVQAAPPVKKTRKPRVPKQPNSEYSNNTIKSLIKIENQQQSSLSQPIQDQSNPIQQTSESVQQKTTQPRKRNKQIKVNAATAATATIVEVSTQQLSQSQTQYIIENPNDIQFIKMFEELNKSRINLKLSQPHSIISTLNINLPEKQHCQALKPLINKLNGKIFNLHIEYLLNQKTDLLNDFDKKLIAYLSRQDETLMTYLEKSKTVTNTSTLLSTVSTTNNSVMTSKSRNKNNASSINSNNSDNNEQSAPLIKHSISSLLAGSNLLKDSNKRLDEALIENTNCIKIEKLDRENESNDQNSGESVVKEYLKKTFNDKINKTQPNFLNVKEELTILSGNKENKDLIDSIQAAKSPIIDLELPNAAAIQLTNDDNNKQLSVTTNITTKKSGSYLKIADILAKESQNQNIIQHQSIQPNEDTQSSENININYNQNNSLTLSNYLTQSKIVTCKFCDSFIEHSSQHSIQLDDKENNSQKPFEFCSEFCKISYQKLVIIRKYSIKTFQSNPKYSFLLPPKQTEDNLLNSINNTALSILNPNSSTNTNNIDDSQTNNTKAKKRSLDGNVVNSNTIVINEKHILKWNQNLINQQQHLQQNQSLNDSLNNSKNEDKNRFETLKPPSNIHDKRICIFCHQIGDHEENGPSRMLTIDVDKWAHLNCSLWSDEVYETMNGALINVDIAYKKCANLVCSLCNQRGASLKCFFPKCNVNYHLICAIKDKCVFNQDKTVYCLNHSSKIPVENRLNNLAVNRSVWIQRDEVAQIQSFMNRDFDEDNYAIRIGSLILHNIGQLLPHQLSSGNFNNRDFIYPVGYKATRIYWSVNKLYKRCRYECSINGGDTEPEFSVTVIEEDDIENETITNKTPSLVWQVLLERLERLRKQNNVVKIFPEYFSGEFMFGLTEPHVTRLIESLPGVETLKNYAFKFGRLQLLDMPLTINPTGCARSEPKLRTHFRKSHHTVCNATSNATSNTTATTSSSAKSQNNESSSQNLHSNQVGTSSSSSSSTYYYNDMDDDENDDNDESNFRSADEGVSVSYTKQFTLSKSTQVKKLRTEWRQNVYLAKSRIQGLGLYAARDLEKNTMIIEYIGELIRNEVANRREKLYESQVSLFFLSF